MKCKDIKGKIIASSERLSASKQFHEIHSHVEDCSDCFHLKEDVESLRSLLLRSAPLVLPKELDKNTYLKCRKELHSLQMGERTTKIQQHLQSIPLYMKLVFMALLVLTGVWVVPFFKDFGFSGETLSASTIIGLFWIIQNVMILLLAPLLLRRSPLKKTQHTVTSIGG